MIRSNKHHISSDEKLVALRRADQFRTWDSLDDKRVCILCERTITGRQVEAAGSGSRIRFHCPSDGCVSTPREWVYPGNPLLSDTAWNDWAAAVETGTAKAAQFQAIRRIAA